MIENGLYVDKPVKRSSQYTFFKIGTGASSQVAPASAKRVGIVIYFGKESDGLINSHSPASADDGIPFPVGSVPYEWYIERHGTIVTKPFFVFAAFATLHVGVLEIMEE